MLPTSAVLPSRAMSMVSIDEIRALARLARLQLSEPEVESLQDDLSAILEHMDLLREVDTTGVLPMTHVGGGGQSLRSDVIAESLDREKILAACQHTEDDCFAVPSILPSGDNS